MSVGLEGLAGGRQKHPPSVNSRKIQKIHITNQDFEDTENRWAEKRERKSPVRGPPAIEAVVTLQIEFNGSAFKKSTKDAKGREEIASLQREEGRGKRERGGRKKEKGKRKKGGKPRFIFDQDHDHDQDQDFEEGGRGMPRPYELSKVRKGSGLDFQHEDMSKIKALTPSYDHDLPLFPLPSSLFTLHWAPTAPFRVSPI